MKNILYILLSFFVLVSCKSKETKKVEAKKATEVSNDGITIRFPDAETSSFFTTEKIDDATVNADLTAPGKITATVQASGQGAGQNIVLFDNPDLSSNYTQLIQHQITINQIQNVSIRQKQLELERTKDLNAHGSATGQELLNIQTELAIEQGNLANEKAAIIEHETKLKAAGFNPETLRRASAGTAYLICDIPENQVSKIKIGQTSTISFTAFPDEKIQGRVDAVADLVDNTTRMVKIRISLINASNKLKSGMFANVSFGINEGTYISVNKTAVITVQGKSYVFIKKSPSELERQLIQIGPQIGDKIIVFSGLNKDAEIATKGVMQLKGLSFGY